MIPLDNIQNGYYTIYKNVSILYTKEGFRMRTALETFFLNIPHSHRIFPEDDPKANALIEALRRGMSEEQRRVFLEF